MKWEGGLALVLTHCQKIANGMMTAADHTNANLRMKNAGYFNLEHQKGIDVRAKIKVTSYSKQLCGSAKKSNGRGFETLATSEVNRRIAAAQ